MAKYSTTREVLQALRDASGDERDAMLEALDSTEIAEGVTALDALQFDWSAWGRDEQQAPDGKRWRFMFLRAGRGGGKTRAGAEMTIDASRDPASCGGQMALIAPTHGDIRITMVEGTSGILACSPPWWMPSWEPGYGHGGRLCWPGVPPAAGHSTGAGASVEALCFSAAKPDRIRGPEIGWVWGDEIAAWGTNGQIVHDLVNPGLRIGTHPRGVYTSTPKPTPFVEFLHALAEADLELAPDKRVYLERVFSTWANADNLPQSTLDELQRRYGGTTQGRQELAAELLIDDPDALWAQSLIDRHAVTPSEVPEIVRAVIAVDNATTASKPGVIDPSTLHGRNRDVGSNDTGIGCAMLGVDGEIYIPNDWTINASPAAWGERVLEAFADCWRGRRADSIVVEKNGGGELIKRNLDVCMRDAGILSRVVPIKWVSAREGKWLRADPVHTLYEQGKVHHIRRPMTAPGAIGALVDLEYQMTRFKLGRTGYKDDRVDWLVYAVTALIDQPRSPGDRRARAAARGRAYVA